MTKIFYIDETGDFARLESTHKNERQPVDIIGGVFIDAAHLGSVTREFIHQKRKFFGKEFSVPQTQYFDWMLPEVKGSMLRNRVFGTNATLRKRTIRFLNNVMEILEKHEVKIVARIWIKGIDMPFDATSVYTSSMQALCSYFDVFLGQENDTGYCVADSRSKVKNINMVHSIFTRKFPKNSSEYANLTEAPLLGNSENHVGIQISDIICSGLLFPIACYSYCSWDIPDNIHVKSAARILKNRYARRLENLQFRYIDNTKKKEDGGIIVSDAMTNRPRDYMFK